MGKHPRVQINQKFFSICTEIIFLIDFYVVLLPFSVGDNRGFWRQRMKDGKILVQ